MLDTPVLAEHFFEHVHTKTKIIQYLTTEYQQHGRAEIHDHMVTFTFGKTPEHYILNSVLKPYRERLKWQGVLVRYEPDQDSTPLKEVQ